ncbi:LutC/YkgG family protein [Tsukamurella spumae]|uniref:LUD domain-containing protein n=1 Tax=Tsukamurella spumae TaxID=44753 RepID=A0A846X4F2_9ACTN|nr:LUD domain-containing protein [Tsukamurella spumae]NKY20547.1 LUD domain-containing protein [Tsukamurella spumae]
MTSAREEILRRVRTALADVADAPVEEAPIPWTYGRPVGTGELGVVDRFAERVADYRAEVRRCAAADLGPTVRAALARFIDDGGASDGGPSGVLGDDVVRELVPGPVPWVADDLLAPDRLDAVAAVVTTATVGIANTGTIVLDHGPGQGRRAVSLVPDVHVCIVRTDQIVDDVPAAVAALRASGAHVRPLTWISGPSATSDIELDRVEGVHGPRTLVVVIVE